MSEGTEKAASGSLYFYITILVVLYSIYRVIHLIRSRCNSTRSSDSIPDAKERTKLFYSRKEAMIKKAREEYLRKHAQKLKTDDQS